jgi:hypothetical protein
MHTIIIVYKCHYGNQEFLLITIKTIIKNKKSHFQLQTIATKSEGLGQSGCHVDQGSSIAASYLVGFGHQKYESTIRSSS